MGFVCHARACADHARIRFSVAVHVDDMIGEQHPVIGVHQQYRHRTELALAIFASGGCLRVVDILDGGEVKAKPDGRSVAAFVN